MTSICSVMSVVDKRMSRYPLCIVEEEEFMVRLRLFSNSGRCADNPNMEELPGEIIRQIAVEQLTSGLTRVKSAADFNLAVKRGTVEIYPSETETDLHTTNDKAQPGTCDVGTKAAIPLPHGLTKPGNSDQSGEEDDTDADETERPEETSTCTAEQHQEGSSVKQTPYTCSICDKVFSKLFALKQHTLGHATTLSHFQTTTLDVGEGDQLNTKLETDLTGQNEPELMEMGIEMDDTGIEDQGSSSEEEEESETDLSLVFEPPTTKESPKDTKDVVPTNMVANVATPERVDFSVRVRLTPHITPPSTPEESPIRKKKGAYVCTFCPRRFSSIPTLQGHISKHTDKQFAEMIFKCKVCDEVYFREADLKKHCCPVKLNSRPYSCDICDKSYFSQYELIVHQRTHSGEKPFACDQCDKKFVSKGALTSHRRIHTGEKPFLCSICGGGFTTKRGAQHHEATHSDVKAHVCDTCGRGFHLEKFLRIHKLVHTGKPHMCEECGRSFLRRKTLTDHLRIHAGVKPYVCKYCGWKFTKEYPLSYHIKSKHKDKLGS